MKGVFLPWLFSASGATRTARLRIEDREVRRARPARAPGRDAEDPRRLGGDARKRRRQARACARRPTSARAAAAARGRSRPARPRRTAGACRPRRPACGPSTARRSTPSARPRDKRFAVALAAQRRLEAAVRVEVAEVHVAQVHVVDRRRRSSPAGLRPSRAASARPRRRVDSRHTCTRAPVARTSSRRVPSAIVSANDGMPGRPRRVATSPSCATPPFASHTSSARSHTGKPKVAAYCSARHSTCVSASGAFACENATQPGVGELAHLGERLPSSFYGQRADRIDARARQRLGAPAQHVDQARLVERRVGVRRAGEAGDAARDRGVHFRLERRLVLLARLAQPRRQVDEAGRHHQAFRVDGLVGLAFRPLDDLPVGHDTRRRPRRGRSPGRPRVPFLMMKLHQFPATMLITAMRTAMPKVTCGRITECGPSATVESISTPRFIGPGCMTMASGLASASLSAVRP